MNWIPINSQLPEANQYVFVKFYYMGNIVEEKCKFLKKQNCFLHDFYSGTGAIEMDDVISWAPREVTGVKTHPWCGIADGVI